MTDARKTLHIAIVGSLRSDDARLFSEKALHTIIEAMGGSDVADLVLLASPSLTDPDSLKAILAAYPQAQVHAVVATDAPFDWTGIPHRLSQLCLQESVVLADSHLYAWILDQCDIAIVFAEKTSAYTTAFDFVNSARKQQIPAVFLQQSHAETDCFWTEKSLYAAYDAQLLKDTVKRLFELPVTQKPDSETDIVGGKLLWGKLYARFMRKYKATVDTKRPYTKDEMMDEAHTLAVNNETSHSAYQRLRQWFSAFDKDANAFGAQYRAAIYLRAVVPLFVTLALAVGFYCETLLGPLSIYIAGGGRSLSILAGIGFFVNSAMILYVYRLSNHKSIGAWHRQFLDNRLMAEALRVAVHFVPFGIPVNFQEFLTRKQVRRHNKKQVICLALKQLLNEASLPALTFTRETGKACLKELEALLHDQIAYHSSTAKRYQTIIRQMKKWGKATFAVGFSLVVLRGVFQLVISVFPISGDFGGISMQGYIKSFANMLALIIPAWAAYFSAKLSFCSFEQLEQNDRMMLDNLQGLLDIVEDEKREDIYSYADVYNLSVQTSQVLLGDISDWYSQLETKTVSRL